MRLTLPLLLLTLSTPAFGAVNDTLKRTDFRSSLCNIADMTVEFRLDEAFGEPLITSRMQWQAGPNTAGDCLSGLTTIWLAARQPDDSMRFIKLSPDISNAGTGFGPTATESPNWSVLFCEAPVDTAQCESADDARALFAADLKVESFDVITESRTFADLGETSARAAEAERILREDDFSLDSLLADAIDEAAGAAASAPPPEPEPELTTEQIAQIQQEREDARAKLAVNNVVTLIASSLAEFRTPSRSCESRRTIANWVQARGTCQLNFRSEANHDFDCGEGDSRPVRATRRANINLSRDVANVAPIRISQEGWATVVLELNDEIRTTTEGSYKTNRWQFTADADRVDDLKALASSLLTLKQYCEATGTS